MSQVLKVANERLGSEDKVLCSYYVECEGKYGSLALSHRQLMFIEIKGFFKKQYTIIFEIPYDQIDEIAIAAHNSLEISTKGKKYIFELDYKRHAEKKLRELIDQAA